MIPKPFEIVTRVSSRGIRSARSRSPIAVRCNPHRSANSSCDQSFSSRNSRIRSPRAINMCCIRRSLECLCPNVYRQAVD